MTYASVTVPYVLEGRQDPPETARVTLTDEQTGQEYEREIPKLETEETSAQCLESFLQEGQTTVGYGVDIVHLAPALEGETVRNFWSTWAFRKSAIV